MVKRKENSQHEIANKLMKVAFGGIAGMTATSILHPMDVIKVRIQVADNNFTSSHMARRMITCEGFGALYRGLSAGLLRQATYTTTRLGIYNWLQDDYKRKYRTNPSLVEKIELGVFAGLAGALVGTPSEVILVRLVTDGPKVPCETTTTKLRYTGTINAINKIIQEEGVCVLWRGGTLTMIRSVFVSTTQIGIYSQAHEVLHDRKMAEGFLLHFYSSVISSVLTAVTSLPADVLKTRYQVRKSGEPSEYLPDLIRKEGVLFLWKGFFPYYVRLGFHTIITFVVLEQMNDFYLLYLEKQK